MQRRRLAARSTRRELEVQRVRYVSAHDRDGGVHDVEHDLQVRVRRRLLSLLVDRTRNAVALLDTTGDAMSAATSERGRRLYASDQLQLWRVRVG